MNTAPQELLKEYVQGQHFTSTAEIMAAMKGMFRDVIQTVMEKCTIPSLCSALPECVIQELLRHTSILDREYGANRNCLESGGYALVAETAEDIVMIKATIDYENHSCEWAEAIGENNEYISALYLLNDDYSILVLLPTAIAPDTLLKELED